jgi:hypothetical protein
MERKRTKISGWFALLATSFQLISCVSWFEPTISYDSRPLLIQTLSAFDQRQVSSESKLNWTGDWIFRRERLGLIDQEIRNDRPDIMILQDLMSRRGSPSESDELILKAGSLRGFESNIDVVKQYEDSQEDESMGVMVATPLKLSLRDESQRYVWGVGADGYLTATVVENEGEPIVIFNVEMPSKIGRKFLWYTFIEERISEFMKQGNYCKERLIIAGYLPADQGAIRFQNFLKDLSLRDSGIGFCAVAGSCFTGTPTNELFVLTNPDEPGAQFDRILVNAQSMVLSASRNIVATEQASPYARQYGLARLWAVQRFGWHATVRLPRCSPPDIEN